MILSRKEFEIILIQYMCKRYEAARITGDTIKVITINSAEITLTLEALYLSYIQGYDFEDTISSICKTINEIASTDTKSVDYSNIYPFIKSKCYNPFAVELIRDDLFLDLDICYVINYQESFRFILESDTVDIKVLKKVAFDNLSILGNQITRIHRGSDIFSLHFPTDFAATLIITRSIQRQIISRIGPNYLFCLPSSSCLLVALDTDSNINTLIELAATDPDANRISNNVYRHRKNGIYEFAYKSME